MNIDNANMSNYKIFKKRFTYSPRFSTLWL